MNILVFCDTAPFPPRNGVTIPSSAYISMLQKKHTVHVVLLLESLEDESEFIAETEMSVERVYKVLRQRVPVSSRIFSEFFRGIPSFHCWKYPQKSYLDEIPFDQYDAFLATPISALDMAIAKRLRDQILVAAISDTYTAVLWGRVRVSVGIKQYLARLRAWRMSSIESAVLRGCNKVIVQTERDIDWLRRIGGDALSKKAVSISNGVSNALLNMPLTLDETNQKRILLVANFADQHYRDTAKWFYSNVWSVLRGLEKGYILRVVGKGLDIDPVFHELLKSDASVELPGFVPRIEDVYSGCTVAVAPIFKDYGFINKVAEAFAAGLPVVGDISAYNGLSKAVDLGIAKTAENQMQFVEKIESLYEDGHLAGLSEVAKQYARENLSWESRRNALELIFVGD